MHFSSINQFYFLNNSKKTTTKLPLLKKKGKRYQENPKISWGKIKEIACWMYILTFYSSKKPLKIKVNLKIQSSVLRIENSSNEKKKIFVRIVNVSQKIGCKNQQNIIMHCWRQDIFWKTKTRWTKKTIKKS